MRGLPRARRLLPTRRWVTADGPDRLEERGAVAARWEPRRSHRPCHRRAISSGHERYVAVSHGHSEGTVNLGARL
jgi:hypothetical protein